MALTSPKDSRSLKNLDNTSIIRPFNVAASIEIVEGAIVSLDGSGNAINAVSTSRCIGIAHNSFNNTVASPTTNTPLNSDRFKHFTLSRFDRQFNGRTSAGRDRVTPGAFLESS